MMDLINLLTNNGIGIVCVAYLIYFQNTTMKKMLETLSTINIRLAIIEGKMNINNEDYLKEVKESETK
jgi:hypothetical protein